MSLSVAQGTKRFEMSLANRTYPAAISTRHQEIRLRDGSNLRLRHLGRGDRERLKAFFASCSTEAVRYRFMSPIKAPSESLLNYLSETDGWRHVALIVTRGQGDRESVVAEGRYVVLPERSDTADIALLVIDEMQRRGIATLLIHRLMEIACMRGVTLFNADVLAENHAMLSLFRKIGRPKSTAVAAGAIHLEIPINCIQADWLAEAA